MAVLAETQPSRVLIVEDDHSLRELLRSYFEEAGHDVTDAYNSSDAIDKVEKLKTEGLRFDSLMTDYNMPPGMNGINLIRHIRGLGQLPPRVVIYTGSEDELNGQCEVLKKDLEKDGVTLLYYYKPCDMDTLTESINPFSESMRPQPRYHNYF